MTQSDDDIREKYLHWENRRQMLAGVPLIPGAFHIDADGNAQRWSDKETAGLDTYIRVLRRMMAFSPDIEYFCDESRASQALKDVAVPFIGLLYKDFGKNIDKDQKLKGVVCAAWEQALSTKVGVMPMSFDNIRLLLGPCIEGEFNCISLNRLTLHSSGHVTCQFEKIEGIFWDIRKNGSLQSAIEGLLAPTPQNTMALFSAPCHFRVSMAPLVDNFPSFRELAVLSFLAVEAREKTIQKRVQYRYKLIAVVRLGDEKYEDQCRVYDETVREALPICFDGIPIAPPKSWSITSTPGKYILWYRKLGQALLDLVENPEAMEKMEDRTDNIMATSTFARRRAMEVADDMLQQISDERKAAITAKPPPKAPKSTPPFLHASSHHSSSRHTSSRGDQSQNRQEGGQGYRGYRGRGDINTGRGRHHPYGRRSRGRGGHRNGGSVHRGSNDQVRGYFERGSQNSGRVSPDFENGYGRHQNAGRGYFQQDSRPGAYGGRGRRESLREELGGSSQNTGSYRESTPSLPSQSEVFGRSRGGIFRNLRSSNKRYSDK